MKLRSKRSAASKFIYAGDELDGTECVPGSGSSDKSSSDKAEDFLCLLENNRGGAEIYEEDNVAECSRNITKVGSRKKRRRTKIEDDDWVEGLSDQGDMEIKMIDDVDEIDFFELEKKRGKKRKKGEKRDPPLLWHAWEAEHEKWLDENMANDIDLDNQNEILDKTVGIPCDLTMPLLKYQNEWLAWALGQEESEAKGGILADEMGMGKTIQAIALVLAKREADCKNGEPNFPIPSPSSSTELPKIKCTLVVCPLVAVSQWVNEIFRFTVEGSTRVLVYHGSNRKKSIQQFSDFDFVITTYSIVESEYRRHVMPPKQMCEFCGNKFHLNKLRIHLKYFCGPDAAKTEKQSKQTKRKEVKSAVKMTIHIPKSGKGDAIHTGEDKKKVDPNKNGIVESIFHSVKWNRIILDEAHYIKGRQNNTAKAIHSMESCYKWALSGTPLQNRVGELYSLVRFLRITPYSYYLCKDCDCKRLDYCSSQVCSFCPHKAVRHFCWWNKNVATPIQTRVNSYGGQRAMYFLKHKILKSILLRRTKKGRAADLALPSRFISLRRDVLDIKEDDYYKSLYSESLAQFDTYVESGTIMNNYAHIFDLLTRLRQAVDHPYLVVYSRTTVINNENSYNNATVCGICTEQVEDLVVTSCGHSFCKACLIGLSSDMSNVLCPSCSEPITVDFTTKINEGDQKSKSTIKRFKRASILNRIHLEDFQTSTKIEALREEIRFMVERDGSAKGIVFSQFTSFLDLINYSLQKCGVLCVQLVGSMTMGARDAAIAKFTNDPNCRIFLMSLKAGGVALNLTAASHVFLMDPWWNPAVEQQAQDRIHRIGQYKPIRIVRFVIENTIEERILKLQEKKELVFEGTVGGSSEALGKLTEADMKFLFMT